MREEGTSKKEEGSSSTAFSAALFRVYPTGDALQLQSQSICHGLALGHKLAGCVKLPAAPTFGINCRTVSDVSVMLEQLRGVEELDHAGGEVVLCTYHHEFSLRNTFF